jgi:hypothetical protein
MPPSRPKIDPEIFDRMVAFRRDLHQHPELSWEEERTSNQVSSRSWTGWAFGTGASGRPGS